MATTWKYKDTNGNIQTVQIDPSYQMLVTLPTDTTEVSVKFQGPTDSTIVEIIGGREKRD